MTPSCSAGSRPAWTCGVGADRQPKPRHGLPRRNRAGEGPAPATPSPARARPGSRCALPHQRPGAPTSTAVNARAHVRTHMRTHVRTRHARMHPGPARAWSRAQVRSRSCARTDLPPGAGAVIGGWGLNGCGAVAEGGWPRGGRGGGAAGGNRRGEERGSGAREGGGRWRGAGRGERARQASALSLAGSITPYALLQVHKSAEPVTHTQSCTQQECFIHFKQHNAPLRIPFNHAHITGIRCLPEKNVCIGCLRRGRADLSSCLKPRPDMRPTWSHDSATPVAGWPVPVAGHGSCDESVDDVTAILHGVARSFAAALRAVAIW